MRTKLTVAVASVACLFAVVPMVAHHSFAAEYDENRPLELTGTVTKVEWTNPHCYFYIDVRDEASGKTNNWALELGNPNALLRNGWTPNTLKVGDSITVEGNGAKDGSFTAHAQVMTLNSTGRRLFSGQNNGPGTNP